MFQLKEKDRLGHDGIMFKKLCLGGGGRTKTITSSVDVLGYMYVPSTR